MSKSSVMRETKASEFAVCQSLARILRVTAEGADVSVTDLCSDFMVIAEPGGLYDMLRSVVGLYPWLVDVTRGVMSSKPNPLQEFLVSKPGSGYILKDKTRAGVDSVWLAVADPERAFRDGMRSAPCRGLFQTVKVGDDISHVVAVQLVTCVIK